MIKEIKDYISKCPYLNELAYIGIEYLDEDAVSYSIVPVNSAQTLKRYVNGDKLKQYGFVFSSREVFGKVEDLTLDNAIFYENFAKWIEENEEKVELEEGKEAIRLEVLSPGYVFQTDLDRGQYRIQLRLLYMEKGENNYGG